MLVCVCVCDGCVCEVYDLNYNLEILEKCYVSTSCLLAKSIALSFHTPIFGIKALDALSLSISLAHDELVARLLLGCHQLQVEMGSVCL